MRIPGWLVALLGVPLVGAGGLWGLFALAAGSPEGVVGALVVLVCGLWLFVGAARDLVPASRSGRAEVLVSAPALIGGELSVVLRLVLPTKLALNPHRQKARFVIEEEWPQYDGPSEQATLHEASLPLQVPLDTVGTWETTWKLSVPANSPNTIDAQNFAIRAWVELCVPYGMFGELNAKTPVVILPEVARG